MVTISGEVVVPGNTLYRLVLSGGEEVGWIQCSSWAEVQTGDIVRVHGPDGMPVLIPLDIGGGESICAVVQGTFPGQEPMLAHAGEALAQANREMAREHTTVRRPAEYISVTLDTPVMESDDGDD